MKIAMSRVARLLQLEGALERVGISQPRHLLRTSKGKDKLFF
jgi:hypothetical protein